MKNILLNLTFVATLVAQPVINCNEVGAETRPSKVESIKNFLARNKGACALAAGTASLSALLYYAERTYLLPKIDTLSQALEDMWKHALESQEGFVDTCLNVVDEKLYTSLKEEHTALAAEELKLVMIDALETRLADSSVKVSEIIPGICGRFSDLSDTLLKKLSLIANHHKGDNTSGAVSTKMTELLNGRFITRDAADYLAVLTGTIAGFIGFSEIAQQQDAENKEADSTGVTEPAPAQ